MWFYADKIWISTLNLNGFGVSLFVFFLEFPKLPNVRTINGFSLSLPIYSLLYILNLFVKFLLVFYIVLNIECMLQLLFPRIVFGFIIFTHLYILIYIEFAILSVSFCSFFFVFSFPFSILYHIYRFHYKNTNKKIINFFIRGS